MIKTCYFKNIAIIFSLVLVFVLTGCAKTKVNALLIPPGFSDLPIAETSEK